MSRKVLISFLGTTQYFPVRYQWDTNTVSERTPFVQEVIARNLCKDWTATDCIMIFRTTRSNTKNWVDKTDENGTVTGKGLASTLMDIEVTDRTGSSRKLECAINPETGADADSYIIETGLSEKELESIFDKVFEKLNDDDEIYFDITHAFRTIPLFATVLFNYARFLKHTAIKGIYYGAFEQLTEEYESVSNIKQLAPEVQDTLVAPIANLTNIVRLQEITSAAASFSDFGNLRAFSKLLFGIEELDVDIKNISDALKDLDGYIQTCQIGKIENGEYISSINRSIVSFCKSAFTTEAQNILLKSISKQLEAFGFVGEASYSNIEAAIDWAVRYNMIQQALTMAQEYIITIAYDCLCDSMAYDGFVGALPPNTKTDNANDLYPIRERLRKIILAEKYHSQNNDSYEFSRNSPLNSLPGATTLINDYRDLFVDMTRDFNRITVLRNTLNHANSTNAANMAYQDYIDEFRTLWERCKEITKTY
ncbi:MAG: TIGR02221 family CRISPR-associated protein [Muribaculaceae bacterium]|nr:TIGR02221 family CRISPR-associated protein [Muribaculaceae bacterium]